LFSHIYYLVESYLDVPCHPVLRHLASIILQSLFYLTIALHVSGIIITHLQEHKTTVTTVSGNRYAMLLSVAIVEELELI
jgi:hypothetical protein